MRRIACVCALLWGPGCVVANQDHCGNQPAGTVCGDAQYCSVCIAENNGCAAEMPEASCRHAGAPTTDTGVGTESTTSATAPEPTYGDSADDTATSTSETSAPISSSSEGTGTTESAAEGGSETADVCVEVGGACDGVPDCCDAADDCEPTAVGGPNCCLNIGSEGCDGDEDCCRGNGTADDAICGDDGACCVPEEGNCMHNNDCCGTLACNILTHKCADL